MADNTSKCGQDSNSRSQASGSSLATLLAPSSGQQAKETNAKEAQEARFWDSRRWRWCRSRSEWRSGSHDAHAKSRIRHSAENNKTLLQLSLTASISYRLPKCSTSFSFSVQTNSIMSESGIRFSVVLFVKGLA